MLDTITNNTTAHAIDKARTSEVERLLACRSDELLKCEPDVLIAALARSVGSGVRDLDALKEEAEMLGRVLVSYSTQLFEAAAQAKVASSTTTNIHIDEEGRYLLKASR